MRSTMTSCCEGLQWTSRLTMRGMSVVRKAYSRTTSHTWVATGQLGIWRQLERSSTFRKGISLVAV
jgi:hypothetical protein